MLANGHKDAARYPIWMVFAEARIVIDRMNAQSANDAALLQMALSTIPSMSVKPASTKKAQKAFQQHLKVLTDG